MESVVSYIRQGGVFVYPIVFGAVWALAILIERTIFYLQTASGLQQTSDRFFAALLGEGAEAAGKVLDGRKGLLSSVLFEGLADANCPPDRLESRMEAVMLKQAPQYSRYLNLLATLAGLMPILGLLGTVTGMIATFKVIALKGTGDAQAMADGISEALITTQAGLVAALPIILGHTLLSNRLKRIVDKTRESAALFIEWAKDTHV